MPSLRWSFMILSVLALPYCAHSQPRVKTGGDLLVEKHLDLVRGKRVGLITNQTGRLSSGEPLVDALRRRGVVVSALFAPEHGVLGMEAAGEGVASGSDTARDIPIYSLYGKTKKPTMEMLRDVDLLLYDLQDVGVRFYTYITTMGLAMEAAAEQGIPIIVLDRPNPLGGNRVEGPVLDDSLKSFVGKFPIPVIYGLTCGELARMSDGEGWLAGSVHPELKVIPMEGWERNMIWEETGLEWIPPSPNIPDPETALIYPGTCFLESSNLSEGRGTAQPFRVIGAPFVAANDLYARLETLNLPGVAFSPAWFTPTSSKEKGISCEGIRLEVTGEKSYESIRTGLAVLREAVELYPRQTKIDKAQLSRLLGSKQAAQAILNGEHPEAALRRENARIELFLHRAMAYRLYP